LNNYKTKPGIFPRGKILGLVHIKRCYKIEKHTNNNIFEKGPICWKFDKVIPLIEKINISGSRKLWILPMKMVTILNFLI